MGSCVMQTTARKVPGDEYEGKTKWKKTSVEDGWWRGRVLIR